MVDVLCVAAHPDDAEMAMGGSLMLLRDKGFRVGVLDLTNGEPTPFGTVKKRLAERDRATKLLGLHERVTLELPNRELQPDLAARKRVAEVIRKLRPKVIFGHYRLDAHPDHVAAAQLTAEARFAAKLTKTDMSGEPHYASRLYYHQANHLRLVMQPAFVLDITPYLERKIKACACYRSQFHTKPRMDFLRRRLREGASYAGSLGGCRYAEAFYSDEVIGLCDIRDTVELSCRDRSGMADIEAWRRSSR